MNSQKDERGFNLSKKFNTGGTEGFYFLAFIGAAVYFISQATDFWSGVVGFLKAIVWPAVLIYEIFVTLSV